MKKMKYSHEELREVSPAIANVALADTYSVPPAYFSDLSNNIFSKIHSNKERAYSFGTTIPYHVPENYFSNLTNQILEKIQSHKKIQEFDVFRETELVAPLLNTITKNPVYNIPNSYFNNTVAAVLTEKKKPEPGIKKLGWFRYAAAAVIIPVIAFAVYTLTERDARGSGFDAEAESAVKNLSREEIVNFLKTNTFYGNTSTPAKNTSVINEIRSSLEEISDKEIQQFLKESGLPDEI